MSDLTCSRCTDLLAEVALGIAAGDDRQAVLDHVDHCAGCRDELRPLADVADRVTALTPHAEPPAGFESRVVAAVSGSGAASSVTGGRAARQRPARSTVVGAVTAAAAAVLLIAGGWWAGRTLPHVSSPAHLTAASLIGGSGGPAQGEVIVSTGGHPWLAMAAEMTASTGTVTCRVVTSGAGTVTVGIFDLSAGYGYWAVPLPAGAGRVEEAQLLSGSSVVASAHFG